MKGDKEDRARTPANIEGSMMDVNIKRRHRRANTAVEKISYP